MTLSNHGKIWSCRAHWPTVTSSLFIICPAMQCPTSCCYCCGCIICGCGWAPGGPPARCTIFARPMLPNPEWGGGPMSIICIGISGSCPTSQSNSNSIKHIVIPQMVLWNFSIILMAGTRHMNTHTHTHTQLFYGPLEFCPRLPG